MGSEDRVAPGQGGNNRRQGIAWGGGIEGQGKVNRRSVAIRQFEAERGDLRVRQRCRNEVKVRAVDDSKARFLEAKWRAQLLHDQPRRCEGRPDPSAHLCERMSTSILPWNALAAPAAPRGSNRTPEIRSRVLRSYGVPANMRQTTRTHVSWHARPGGHPVASTCSRRARPG